MQLLNARVQAKRLARSASHTMIQALDNNPLKFSPTAEDALRIMFGPPTRSYLDASRAIEQGFDDLKTHQIKTYSAMQHALATLMADLDPETIDSGYRRRPRHRRAARIAQGQALGRLSWRAGRQRCAARTAGSVDAFMLLFRRVLRPRRRA